MTTANANANRQIARAAGTVMFAILFGQLAGLVSKILIADAFPAAELDAFFSANRVSETLFTLIAAGALGSAFLPTFTSLLVKNERTAAWKLASSLISQLTKPFKPDQFKDEYSEKLLKVIEAKAKGKSATVKPLKVVHTATTEDLMQKLKASLKPATKKAS